MKVLWLAHPYTHIHPYTQYYNTNLHFSPIFSNLRTASPQRSPNMVTAHPFPIWWVSVCGVGWELCSSNVIIIHEYTVGVREMLVVDVCDVCVMCVDMCTWFSGTPENVRRNTRTQACCTASHCKLERVGVLGNRGEVKDTCSGARVWHMMWTFCMTENFFFSKISVSEKFLKNLLWHRGKLSTLYSVVSLHH